MATSLNPAIFRSYDIRGVADRDLGDDLVVALGRAFATWVGRRRGGKKIALGRDCRTTSPRLAQAMRQGLEQSGASVLDIGVVPSPVVYFSAHHCATDGAIVITGSHNPSPDNGFKMMLGTSSVHTDAIVELKSLIETSDFDFAGGTTETIELADAYLDRVCAGIELGSTPRRVVIDAGHGAAGPLALALMKRLGVEVTPLYCEMDGTFPAHHPDPTVVENLGDLQRTVRETRADLGIAFDGDGDRLGAVDEHGRVLFGDQLMLLFGQDIIRASAEPPTFIAEVKCSQALFDGLRAAGGKAIMWKVGHSLIKDKMKETGAALAGEMSGHLFFADRYLGYDDALYAGARLIELLSRTDLSLGDLRDRLPQTVATPEIRVPCPDESKFSVVEAVAASLSAREDVLETITIDGVRAVWQDGWGLVRASNTQPSLVLRIEAVDTAALTKIRSLLERAIAGAQEAT